jgi:hypothetical protein
MPEFSIDAKLLQIEHLIQDWQLLALAVFPIADPIDTRGSWVR